MQSNEKYTHSWRLIAFLLGIFVSFSLLVNPLYAESNSASNGVEDMAFEIGEPASDSGWTDSAEALYQFGITSEFTQAYNHGLIVSSDADYSFTAIKDRTLTASFRKAVLPGVLMLLLDDE